MLSCVFSRYFVYLVALFLATFLHTFLPTLLLISLYAFPCFCYFSCVFYCLDFSYLSCILFAKFLVTFLEHNLEEFLPFFMRTFCLLPHYFSCILFTLLYWYFSCIFSCLLPCYFSCMFSCRILCYLLCVRFCLVKCCLLPTIVLYTLCIVSR